MAIKGQISKENLIKELLEYFGDRAFRYDKDLRVNCIEDGHPCQIKLNFTVSKVAVEKDGDTALPAATATPIPRSDMIDFENPVPTPQPVTEPTAQEKANIKNLLEKLGL